MSSSNLPPPIPNFSKGETPSPTHKLRMPSSEGRRNSFSGSTTKTFQNPQAPSEPISPSQASSPRQRRPQQASLIKQIKNLSDNEGAYKIPNISQNRTKLILEILERNDVREMLYKRCDNCCIFPTEKNMDNKSFDEQKFMRREYPSYFSTDRQFFRFLMHQFSDALQGVEDRFPSYFSIDKLDDYQMEGMINELDLWFTLFDECIGQESQHSKVNSYIMKQIMEVFQQDFLLLVNQLKKERKKYQEMAGSNEGKEDQSEARKLNKQQDKFALENARIKRENASLQEDLKKSHIEKFELKNQLDEAHDQINQLLESINQLRESVAAGQESITEMIREKPSEALDEKLTSVPKDVLETWTQCSQFLTVILNDELTNLDFNSLFLDNLKNNDGTLAKYLSFPKPDVYKFIGQNVHYSKLLSAIKIFKKENDPNTIFDLLSGKIRELFKKFSIFYNNRILQHRKGDKEKQSKLKKQLKELKEVNPDQNWMKYFLNNSELYNIPKKGTPNIQNQILFIFQKSAELMKNGLNKPRNVSEVVRKCYSGDELILFLAQLSKQSDSDICADMFRQFVSNELPYHMYLYYSKIVTLNEKLDLIKRVALLSSQFKDYGFIEIPQQKRRSFESKYCSSPVTFPIFVLAIYQFIIENIALEISNTINQKDLNGFLRDKYNDDDLCDYLLAISEKDDPSILEYASLLFTFKKEQFPKALRDFDPQQSKLLQYMSTFGQEKEKEKKKQPKKSRSKSPSRHIRPSSNLGDIPQLSIQNENVDTIGGTHNEDIPITTKQPLLLEEEEDEKEVNVLIDINLPTDDDEE
ncbi:hypothetical protein M9Y10_026259 [Tritrichomonas musculus]|uniref:Translin-associated factor X-interacting protein 1 N-terminal domain-containing protein n=1 Tax=Tritrichomonas musculus TaxID=1915356 RepID=A0ABR2H8Z4_9EUKA